MRTWAAMPQAAAAGPAPPAGSLPCDTAAAAPGPRGLAEQRAGSARPAAELAAAASPPEGLPAPPLLPLPPPRASAAPRARWLPAPRERNRGGGPAAHWRRRSRSSWRHEPPGPAAAVGPSPQSRSGGGRRGMAAAGASGGGGAGLGGGRGGCGGADRRTGGQTETRVFARLWMSEARQGTGGRRQVRAAPSEKRPGSCGGRAGGGTRCWSGRVSVPSLPPHLGPAHRPVPPAAGGRSPQRGSCRPRPVPESGIPPGEPV